MNKFIEHTISNIDREEEFYNGVYQEIDGMTYKFTRIRANTLRNSERPGYLESVLISFGTWIISPWEGEYWRVELV